VALSGNRTFVGFGFGPIQAGLFLYEAYESGNFSRLVAAEILPDVVRSVRDGGGQFTVNIARRDRIEAATIGPVDIRNPAVDTDRHCLVEAVADADEIATAVPSIDCYVSEGPGSLHRILAEGLRLKGFRRGPRAVVYASENHNHAAEILEDAVRGAISPDARDTLRSRVRFLNTVIGKMSGTTSADEPLGSIAPGLRRAFLVESFNRILISAVDFGEAPQRFERGIGILEEKADLLPFEHAKLYGHNATHALAAYTASARGLTRIAELNDCPDILGFLRSAFLEESGRALITLHQGVDPLFTPKGYEEFCDDLLQRMLNPYLGDTVERVGRDPRRKLGWDDRLIGTIRIALRAGIRPARYALGAAAALSLIEPQILQRDLDPSPALERLWGRATRPRDEASTVAELVRGAAEALRRWRESEFQDIRLFA
jgi:mannitol-1-phosphate 5-dehydrogenase